MKKTNDEAQEHMCPMTFFGSNGRKNCIGERCMAWKVIDKELQRENHSGGMQMMLEASARRGHQKIMRDGIGCDGILILRERGICTLIPNQ